MELEAHEEALIWDDYLDFMKFLREPHNFKCMEEARKAFDQGRRK